MKKLRSLYRISRHLSRTFLVQFRNNLKYLNRKVRNISQMKYMFNQSREKLEKFHSRIMNHVVFQHFNSGNPNLENLSDSGLLKNHNTIFAFNVSVMCNFSCCDSARIVLLRTMNSSYITSQKTNFINFKLQTIIWLTKLWCC